MIHLNIGSNLNSNLGSRFDNITIATHLLLESKLRIKKISNFYETPSYPNKSFPKFINIGILADFKKDCLELLRNISLIEKKIGRVKSKKNDPRKIDIDIIDFNSKIIDSNKLYLPHPKAHLIRNLIPYLKNDKKNNDDKINFILLKKIGQTTKPNSYKISIDKVKQYSKLIAQY